MGSSAYGSALASRRSPRPCRPPGAFTPAARPSPARPRAPWLRQQVRRAWTVGHGHGAAPLWAVAPPMPMWCGAPPCPPRALAGVLCGGGGSAGGRCCAPIHRACFLRPTKKSEGALGYQMKNCRWRPTFALETGGPSNTDGQDFDEDSGFLGRTRLGRLIQAAARELLDKLNSARTNSPTKIFLVLLGFYTANALATILGQTGDWDVLVAGVVVAAIEGIGMLMYRKPIARPPGRFQSLISMVNYWKAGVCLGLFVDAFKLGS